MISETLIKTLAKAIDFEKIIGQLQADPRVNEALALAANIQQDFATIKNTQAEILVQLDLLRVKLESQSAPRVKKSLANTYPAVQGEPDKEN